jgi:bla regulator protein blaR1
MTAAALVAAALGGIALPHALRLERADPAAACVLWAAALGLRALVVVGTVAGALVLLHPGHLLVAVAEWPCAPHHRVAGHAVAAVVGMALAVSLLWALARIAQAMLAVRRLVRASVGRGPGGSLIVGGDDVVLAAAGLAHPTLLVSAGALARLDDAELAAAMAHEHAHIRRRHRYVLLFAELCRVLGRPLPGTGHAVRQLRFQLERDADRAAVRADRADRLALASAICKAASGAPSRPGMAALGGDGTAARVRELLEAAAPDARSRGLKALAAGAVTLAVGAALALPSTVGALGDPVVLCGGA